MSSLSVRFLTPPLSHATPSSSARQRLFAGPPTVAQPVDAGRLEPRVDERDGYYVLKEKFRQGINPQEKVKIKTEPMKLFMENGIEELAKLSMEEIDKEKSSKDDIDVRLKWLGLLHRRKHRHCRFMIRLKLPNGVTTSAQTRYLASVIRKYGKDGWADVTTRQNWQIRGLQSGMDNVRNPVGNPLAGIDPDEIVDTGPYTNLLPRKWNVCVVGSHDLYEHPHINDLAYVPPLKDLRFGFNFLVGGLFSPKRRAEAVPLDAWVPVCRAVLEACIDLGFRRNRQKTRMMWWLIDELGIEGFRSEVVKRIPHQWLENLLKI
ncbi:hypothetical protein POPTR_009G101600v4 [Populus trichocarpa]|uniref:Uncharacterized protein n=1 Tax=Populus trichocarpa TaxID=3694 RepID=A0ACC0SHI6_POPTR|nr:hypothetical protein POPTR_009G101600v4 [Populus trichocarpa]